MVAFAFNDITKSVEFIDVSGVMEFFNHLTDWDLRRQVGQVDLLIGIQYAGLHPHGGEETAVHGHLRLLRSKFGTGFLLDGTHPAISTGPTRMERSVFYITRGQHGALVYENTVARQPKLVNLTKKVPPLSFLECEELVAATIVASVQPEELRCQGRIGQS